MKLTPILYVRSWLQRLHPPMPMTPKENQQLLSVLKSSFQRRLDDAHPPVRPAEPPPPSTMPGLGPVVDNKPARATVDHLQSLLQHPLLAQSPMNGTKTESAASKAVKMMDQAMLHGGDQSELVDRSLRLYMRNMPKGNTVMRDDIDLGRRVTAWFSISDDATRVKFLASPSMLRNAVPILYANGQEEAVWGWLGTLYSRTIESEGGRQQNNLSGSATPLQLVSQELHLTFLMIKEVLRRGRLDSAVMQFVQACAYMQKTDRMSLEVRSSQPWQATIQAVTMAVLRRRKGHGLSVELFDELLKYGALWPDQMSLTFELVSVYHPTQPSANQLAQTVGQANDRIAAIFDKAKLMSKTAQIVVLNCLLDGVQLLLSQKSGDVRQAQIILKTIEEHFPTPIHSKSKVATQRRIQTAQRIISSQEFMPASLGVA